VHLNDARLALKRLYTALSGLGAVPCEPVDWAGAHAQRFKAAMDDDFSTPEAVAVLFDMASELNRSPDVRMAAQFKALGGVLGLLQQDPNAYLKAGSGVDAQIIENLVAERAQAKAARNFARADSIRQELLDQGVVLKDGATGTTWERL
jgi:cysteinyl-tRNA synthetase